MERVSVPITAPTIPILTREFGSEAPVACRAQEKPRREAGAKRNNDKQIKCIPK